MARLKILLPFILGLALAGRARALAKPTFNSSEIEGPGSEIIFCDLDGDGLKDAVLIDGRNLSIFYQDPKGGFARRAQQHYRLADQPAVIWTARLGGPAESLLVMTSDGITALSFTNRIGPPGRQQIIKEQTIIPDSLDETEVIYIPLSANTGTDWPLLLAPVAGGLQIWQHGDAWRQAQFIEQAVDMRLRPSVTNAGYTRSFGLSLSVGDVNGDRRDDLMIKRDVAGGRQAFTLYLQQTNGLFGLEPAMTYTNADDWRTALRWEDFNRDGGVDLVKSTVSDEPSFVPGLQSSKVLVAIYLADERGRIPAEPQAIFRKNDWSSVLPMVDVDGDGYPDLMLGYNPVVSPEGARNMLTAGKVNLNLKFHFFRPGAGYSSEPDFERAVSIYFDHEFNWTLERRIYHERFVTLDGDFNGDGKEDLLVRDSRDTISVYYFVSREKGFNSQADLQFHCPELIDGWQVEDLNGDGISDLVVKLRNQNVFRIFISQGK